MNKLKYGLVVLSLFLFLIGSQSSAIPTGSLNNFKETKQMIESTFSDVKSDKWFYAGIKTAFDYGIMDGVSIGRFAPNDNLTIAQAITITAKVHATYFKQQIPDTGSKIWYDKYYQYLQNNELLSPDSVLATDAPTRFITRTEIATLFSKVLSDADAMAINDTKIPDLNSISSTYQNAVMKMYASGIMGGKAGGKFDGNNLATRGEIATIIGRIINPYSRLAHDIKYNEQIKGQEGNIQSFGNVFEYGHMMYIVYWDKDFSRYNIAEYNNLTKFANVIYYGDRLRDQSNYESPKIRTMKDRQLYITETSFDIRTYESLSKAKKINLDTLAVTEMYDGVNMTGFTIYGDEIYALTVRENPVWDYKDPNSKYKLYQIIQIDDSNTAIPLINGEGYANTLSGINDHLYYQADGKIMELDLKSMEELPIVQSVTTSTICENVVYYIDMNGNVYKSMLNNVSSKKLLYSGNASTMGFPWDINWYKNALYFNFDWLYRIDKINEKGQWSSIATKKSNFEFGMLDGYIVYSDYDSNDYIAPIGFDPSMHLDLATWLFP